jgi:hypothetical protein
MEIVSPISPINAVVVPAKLPRKLVGRGRVELAEKITSASILNAEEIEANESKVQGHRGSREPETQAQYGLRPEEMDASGRYTGELHSDGRRYNYMSTDAESP